MIAAVTAIGGRRGRVLSSDGALRLTLAPTSSEGSDAIRPEQLLAAGCAASFLDAVRDAAARCGAVLGSQWNVTASVVEAERSERFAVALDVDLPGVERTAAEALVAAALDLCPFAVTLRASVALTIAIA